MYNGNLTIVVGLSNLGEEGRPADDDLAFDPLMTREAAEELTATFRLSGLAPPSQGMAFNRGATSPRSALTRANVLLASRSLPTHDEPANAPRWMPAVPNPLPLDALHRLRRLQAHRMVRPGLAIEPLPAGDDARDDPVMGEAGDRRDSHLLNHGDREGFYLPIQIGGAVRDVSGTALAGGWIGSSYRLAEELRQLAPLLGVSLEDGPLDRAAREDLAAQLAPADPFHLEKWAWLLHEEAAAFSTRHGLAILYR